jgi:hypothetical protein
LVASDGSYTSALTVAGDRPRRSGDLPDREALELAVMAREGDRPATLDHTIGTRA